MALPEGTHTFAVVDVDGDAAADLIAQKDETGEADRRRGRRWWSRLWRVLGPDGDDDGGLGLYWLEAAVEPGPVPGAAGWTAHRIGAVPRASHDLGAQGYRVAAAPALRRRR